MMHLAMLETIRVLRGETEEGQEMEAMEEQEMEALDDDAQEESESDEDEEDVAALYQRMNISRRMSLPANLTLLKHDDSQRRLQRLQRARRGNFREDDSQEEGEEREEEEEEEESREESLMCRSRPMAMYTGSPASSDVGCRRLPDVLWPGSPPARSSNTNPLPDLLPPQASLPAALDDCPDSRSVLYRSIRSDSQRVGPESGWVGIGEGLNRLAGTAADKGILDQRRKSCVGSKLVSGEVAASLSQRRKMTRRRSVAGTGGMENTRGTRSEQRGIFRDICAIVSIFGFYICVRKIESLLK